MNKTKKPKIDLSWADMLNLVDSLIKDRKYSIAAIIYIGCHTGMRISDILSMRWCDLLDKKQISFMESRTSKLRTITLTEENQRFLSNIYSFMGVKEIESFCFISRKHTVFTIQRVNVMLKEINTQYRLGIEHFTTNTLRVTYGRQVYRKTKGKAIDGLREYFSHPTIDFTLNYLHLNKTNNNSQLII